MENPDNRKRLFEEFPPVPPSEWENEIAKDLGGADIRRLDWKPCEGFTVRPFYTAGDLEGLEYLTENAPGEFPYVRGAGGGDNAWKIDERISAGTVKEANRLALNAIENGCTSLTFVCEIRGDRIKGVPVQNSADMSRLLKGVPLGDVEINFIAGAGGPAILSLFTGEAVKRGIDPAGLKGSLDTDPLGELALRGHFPGGERGSFEELRSVISYLSSGAPSFKALTVHGDHFHNAGASAAEELAFTLASGVEYMDRLTRMDLTPAEIASHMNFSVPVGSNYFMEIAKLRAARLLWAEIVKQYAPEDESAGRMSIRAVTSSWTKTLFDPYVNMLRGTVEAMAASIGRSAAIRVLPLDSVYEPAGEFTGRMARNTQLILKHESYIDRVTDPAAGSYYIERLTDSIADASLKLFLEVEKMGGFVEAFKAGFIQERIENTARQRDMNVALGRDVFVGVNQYPDLKEKAPKISPLIKESPLRKSRPQTGNSVLKSLEETIEYLSRKGSYIGDIVRPEDADPGPAVKPLTPYRGAQAFEALRLNTLAYIKKTKKKPAAFLLSAGNVSMRNARAAFSANFFGCAGFAILENDASGSLDDSIGQAVKSRAGIVVLCSSDKEYPEIAPGICKAIKDKNPGVYVLIAGNPVQHIEELRASGIDDFIHARSNVLEVLQKYQRLLGIASGGGGAA